MKVCSGKAAQDHGLLRKFENLAYFSAKDGKVNSRAKKFVFWVSKEREKAIGCGIPKTRRTC